MTLLIQNSTPVQSLVQVLVLDQNLAQILILVQNQNPIIDEGRDRVKSLSGGFGKVGYSFLK